MTSSSTRKLILPDWKDPEIYELSRDTLLLNNNLRFDQFGILSDEYKHTGNSIADESHFLKGELMRKSLRQEVQKPGKVLSSTEEGAQKNLFTGDYRGKDDDSLPNLDRKGSRQEEYQNKSQDSSPSSLRDVSISSIQGATKVELRGNMGIVLSPELKSWLHSLSEKLTAAKVCFNEISSSINSEGDLAKLKVEKLLNPVYAKLISHHEDLPKEAKTVEGAVHGLIDAFQSTLIEASECFQCRKDAYQAQLKRVRDISNQAIRNSLQMERGEALALCHHTQTKAKAQIEDAIKNHQEEIAVFLIQIERTRQENEMIRQQLEVYSERDLKHQLHETEAIQEALKLQKEMHLEELQQCRLQFKEDLEHFKVESQRNLERLNEAHSSSLDELKRVELEKRQILSQEKTRLEGECKHLREELANLKLEASMVREKSDSLIREERTLNEKALAEQLARSLQAQATMKADIAAMMQRYQVEDSKRRNDMDAQFRNLRDSLIQSHALDMEALQEKHRRETKRLQAELEVQFEENLMKVNHIHEQELSRQIRETDRLQRLLVRHGMPSAALSEIAIDSIATSKFAEYDNKENSRFSTKGGYSSLTPNRGFNKEPQNTSSPPPPPPPLSTQPLSSQRTTSSLAKDANQDPIKESDLRLKPRPINWGSLSDSLLHQEKRNQSQQPTFSSLNMPPSSFPLDEALASTQPGRSSAGGRGISANVRRVSSYLQDLESYLKGTEKSESDPLYTDRNASSDSSTDVSIHTQSVGLLGGSLLGQDSSSVSINTSFLRDNNLAVNLSI